MENGATWPKTIGREIKGVTNFIRTITPGILD